MAELKDIALYGAGGFGREVACMIRRINEQKPTWNLIGFFDSNPAQKGTQVSHFGPCFGGLGELNAWDRELAVALTIGDPLEVKKVYDAIANDRLWFPNLIHPYGAFSDDPESFVIGKGNIIKSGCSATCDVHIGDFNVFNGDVVLGHDVGIGSFNSFKGGVRISGYVKIGECNFFGTGSIVIPHIVIGHHVKLVAGSTLMTNPRDGFLYMGVPAVKTEF